MARSLCVYQGDDNRHLFLGVIETVCERPEWYSPTFGEEGCSTLYGVPRTCWGTECPIPVCPPASRH